MDSGCYRRELFLVLYVLFLSDWWFMQESSKIPLSRKISLRIAGTKKGAGILFLVSSFWPRSWFLNALNISWNGPKIDTHHPPVKHRRSLIGVTCGIILLRGRTLDLLVIAGVFWLEWAYWALEKCEKNDKNPSIWGCFTGRICCVWKIWWQSFLDCLWLKITESRNIFDIRWSSTVTLTKIDNWCSEDFLSFWYTNIAIQNGQKRPGPLRNARQVRWYMRLNLLFVTPTPVVLGMSLLFFNGQQNYISLERGMRCVKDGEILASKHWKRRIRWMFDNWMILTKLGWLAFIEFEAMMRMYFFQKTIGQGNLKQLAKQEHWKYLPASMVYEMIQLTAISLWSVLVRWSTRRTLSLEWKNVFGHLVLTICQTHCHVPTPYLSWTAWFRLLINDSWH